jgi:hypothetical protein
MGIWKISIVIWLIGYIFLRNTVNHRNEQLSTEMTNLTSGNVVFMFLWLADFPVPEICGSQNHHKSICDSRNRKCESQISGGRIHAKDRNIVRP